MLRSTRSQSKLQCMARSNQTKMNNILLLYQLGSVDSWLSARGFGCCRGSCAQWHWSLLRRCSFSVGVPEQEPSRVLGEGALGTTGLCVGEKGQGAWTWWGTRAAFLSCTWLDDGYPVCSAMTVNDPDSSINIMLEQNREIRVCHPWDVANL